MTDSEPEAGKRIVVEVTQGGINNNYVALARHSGFFPADAIGPADEGDGRGAQVAVRFAGTGEEVLTDIAGGHRTFRRRGAWGRFFAHHGLGPGDNVIIERRSPYAYDVRPADQPAYQPLPGEPGREWSAAEVSAVVTDYLAMLAGEADGRDFSKAEHRRGLLARLAPGRTPQAVAPAASRPRAGRDPTAAAAFEFEQRRLRGIDRDDLATQVRWAARDDGDGLGYDVLSFDDAGRERDIEVKTTGLGALTPFYMSSAELDFARSHPDSYVLYRIYDATTSPRFFTLEGDVSAAAEFFPATYRLQLAATGDHDRSAGPGHSLT